MEGKELTARERGKVGPVAQADNDNQGLARWVAWPPPPRAYAYEAQVHGLVVENRVSFWG
jgi:hypothetical protein